jgi:nickel transport protein
MRYLFVLFLLFNFSNAHKINLFITNENDTLDIYSYFANGAPCKNCELIIKNEDKIILKDSLNDEGKYQYKSTFKNIEVIVDATGGHKASEKLEIANIHNEDLKEHLNKEENKKYTNILLGLLLIFIIFFLLKKTKK